MAIHESQVTDLALNLGNLYRLSLLGYADSRLTSLTTVASLIADFVTYKGLVNANDAPAVDAAIQTVSWMERNDLLDTTLVTALTTFYDLTVSATTDLSYNIRGHAQYPATFPNTGADVTHFQPAYQ